MQKHHLSRGLSAALAAAMAFTATAAPVYAEGEQQKATAGGVISDSVREAVQATVQGQMTANKVDVSALLQSERVDFIVEMEEPSILEAMPANTEVQVYLSSAMAEARAAAIEKQQQAVKAEILKGGAATIEYSYSKLLNGFAVNADYSEKERLEAIPGVKAVYVAQTYDYVDPSTGYTQATHTSGEMMNSDSANAEGYTGKGTVTAVLDTGLDVAHEAFQNDPESPRFTEQTVSDALASGEINAEAAASDLYVSAKIPFAYDYADKDVDVLGPETHGTHVSGTVGADCDYFTGVAPDTQIVVMKVFSDASSGASDTDIFAALEDCVSLGVDTINMSLGSPSGFSTADALTEQVYGAVEAAGINLLCAAGNETSSTYMNQYGTDLALVENPDSGIVGSPSTYSAALSVASINEKYAYTTYFMHGEDKIAYNDTATSDEAMFASLSGTYEYVAVPGVGAVSDYTGLDVNGKIALVKRGTIAFTEKEANAKSAGAVAVIVYDNVEGSLLNMQTNESLPMVAITKAAGEALAAAEDKTVTLSPDYAEEMPEVSTGNQMSDFSSLGVAPDLSLKPEITAPGGSVYSTLPGDTYGNMNGTSMASPHMAGAVSVMKQYVNEAFPELTSTEKQELINNLLMSTAMPVEDPYGVAYTPRKEGAGLANVSNAIHTGAYLTVSGATRAKAELGADANGSFSFTFTVHNLTEDALSYDVGAIPLVAKVVDMEGIESISEYSRELTADEFSVSFSQDSVTVPANGSVDVTVTMQLTGTGKQNLAVFSNGIFLDGFVVLASANEDGIDLSLPYLGFYGDWAAAPVFDTTMYTGELGFMGESSLLALNMLTGSGLYLGMNGFTGETSADKIAVATSNSQDRIYWAYGYELVAPMSYLLRAPKKMTYSVTAKDVYALLNEDGTEFADWNGKEAFHDEIENVMKSFYYSNYGINFYDLSTGWSPLFEGSLFDPNDEYTYWMPDGDYEMTLTAEVDGTDGATQSLTYPFAIDNQAPQILGTQYVVEDDTPYLDVTVTDENHVMGVVLLDQQGQYLLAPVAALNEAERGATSTVRFDLTEAQADGETLGIIAVLDYAQNEFDSDYVSLISQDILPTSVKINNQSITASTTSSPMDLTVTVEPENAVDKSVTWSSDAPDVVSVDQNGHIEFLAAGVATIKATAVNGVYGTTTIYVSDWEVDFPEDYVIREDGAYQIPEGLKNQKITITDDAHNVVLNGNASNDNVYFVSLNTDLALTINGLNIKMSRSNPIITFIGTGNKLIVKGENTLSSPDSSYFSKALVSVAEGVELAVGGDGVLNLSNGSSTYGAGIGGDAGKIAGSITVNGATINLTVKGEGAGIGGGSNAAAQSIVINDGVINVDVPLASGGWSNNSNNCGAGIGTGNYASKGTVDITVNGGEINGTTAVNAPVVGSAHRSTIGGSITVNGGKINATSAYGDSSTYNAGGAAAIGTGDQAATLDITINGGEVIATAKLADGVANNYGAAIGGGGGASNGTVTINGGTVTAVATNGQPAIGGGYTTEATGRVVINGGSVKAVANDGVAAIAVTPVDSNGATVYENQITAPNVQSVMVDGKDMKVSVNHPDDDTIYLWLPEGKHTGVVDGAKYEINAGTSPTVFQYFDVLYNLANLTTNGDHTATYNSVAAGKMVADAGYVLPENIDVVMEGGTANYTYDAETGDFMITKITGDVTVTAAAILPATDRSELETLITQADNLDENLYTPETWSELQKVLDDARAVYENPNATQEEVDAAADALKAALEALAVKADLSELYTLVAQARKLVEADYTSDSWAALQQALDQANAVIALGDSASQEDVDAAVAALRSAIEALVKRADMTDLNKAIETAEGLLPGNYTEESWNANEKDLEWALERARLVASNPDATQEEVDKAAKDLWDVINALVPLADKTELEKTIGVAENLNGEDYTSATWELLQKALDDAKAVYDDPNASQAEVDEAQAALQRAINALVLRGDKTELDRLIGEASGLDGEDYTDSSWDALQDALDAAKAVSENPDATQKEIDDAVAALKAALAALEETSSVNKDALNQVIGEAEALNEGDYTAETWAELEKALEKAKEVAANEGASQAEVDAAKAILEHAMENLVKTGTAVKDPITGDEPEPVKPSPTPAPTPAPTTAPSDSTGSGTTTTTTTTSGTSSTIPQTGDSMNFGLVVFAMVGSVAALGALVMLKKKRD